MYTNIGFWNEIFRKIQIIFPSKKTFLREAEKKIMAGPLREGLKNTNSCGHFRKRGGQPTSATKWGFFT